VTRVYKHSIGSAKPDTFFDRNTLSKAGKNVPFERQVTVSRLQLIVLWISHGLAQVSRRDRLFNVISVFFVLMVFLF